MGTLAAFRKLATESLRRAAIRPLIPGHGCRWRKNGLAQGAGKAHLESFPQVKQI